MPLPARNTIAIVGAGPIGLEAALAALDAGLDAHVFERGDVGAHALAWGHVRMFTPWRMNVGAATRRHLEASAWTAPDPDACPTGAEFVQQVLAPAAQLAELAGRIHTHAQVVHMSRSGLLKSDAPGEAIRAEHPFRLLVRDVGGRENFLHAFALLDVSGVYGQPNWAGDGGIPARSELYLAPQLSYHVDDVLGIQRERYAGKRVMVIGAGASAATTLGDLARLAGEAAGTEVVWVTRREAASLYAGPSDDPLPERRALYARARAIAGGGQATLSHVGGARVDGFEFNSATHRFRVGLKVGDQARVEEVDRVIVNTGFGPDDSLYRELQVQESFVTRGPAGVAAAVAGSSDCLSAPAAGLGPLANPEPNFYVLGHKSYGRNPHFLLETGYRQVAEVIAALAAGLRSGAPA